MRPAWQKPEHFGHWAGQRTLRGNLLGKLGQLFSVRQLAIEQQVSDFLKTRLLRHFMNVVAAIHEPGIGIDPADRRFACNPPSQTGTVLWFGFVAHGSVLSYSRIGNVQTIQRSNDLTGVPTLGSRVVIEELIKLLARSHFIEPTRLCPALLQIAQEFVARFHRNAKRAHRKNYDSVSEIGQLLKRKQGTLAKLRHVREQRRFYFAGEGFEFLVGLQSFRKNPVRARLDIAPRALDCAIEIFDRARVYARND